MYEHVTYDEIMRRMLERVSSPVDKREGSLIWDALAPAAVELQMMYIELDNILRETFADTASREYLIKRAAERGITPTAATHAILRGEFNIPVEIGSRFSLELLNYTVIELLQDGTYKVQCETAGEEGNRYLGTLIPIDYIKGLTKAELTAVLIPGENEEETEHLRNRYFSSFQSKAFGGNIQDYREKVSAMAGVGAVKVLPTFAGGFSPSMLRPPASVEGWLEAAEAIPVSVRQWLEVVLSAFQEGVVTVGAGTVRIVLLDSQWSAPTQELLETVQTTMDPEGNQGEGYGEAPIGHVVTVIGASEVAVDIATNISFQNGYSWERLQELLKSAVDNYLLELRKEWADSEQLVVRISQMETRLLAVTGVLDISGTVLNGEEENLILQSVEIPVRGLLHETGG